MALMNVVFDQLIGSFNGDTGTQSTLGQKTSFFDKDGNSVNQLTARLQSNIKSPMELLELNLIVVIIGMFTLIGALINYLLHLRLEARARCLVHDRPIQHVRGLSYRVRYELQFNAMNETVFCESTKFGAESISAYRTVTALVMAENIRSRYESLLQ
ncbi:hypothetical protein NEUTE1DRAFT_142350 [Neurospora tetrasperma FGSC 2508]|uniref:ABC transmembrane type-1 domain-containing protein n=1 Tax=Neurospora tetrasperma (strain FGSC 2508 / ATCC MYA-4615 / P0657) TaxID=510951 RepID=F8N2J8_NEUT8|nr:uncharacterized protein NEUTE1DRAFT_142350 [Neurospora tetrasperma FGSC 2508]EGO52466.1 hypothetical protein NEUTE1DRAFT_142350 [Neurospora tetrasperma FGSC 2508]